MRSTGEVLGLARDPGLAYFKAEEGTQLRLPSEGTVLITTIEKDQSSIPEIAQRFTRLGFKIRATEGTHHFLAEHGVTSEHILKFHEGRPNIVDAIKNGEIQLIINTPSGKLSKHDDSYIRKSAIKYKVPYITTLAAAMAAVKGIEAYQADHGLVKSLQGYHMDIERLQGGNNS
jgi:carbamoyl-phosphate synthase large subunit